MPHDITIHKSYLYDFGMAASNKTTPSHNDTSVANRTDTACYIKIKFLGNEASMVQRWLHNLEQLLPWENLSQIDHSACFLRTQSQRTYIVGEVLTTPPSQLMHGVVYFLQPFFFADKRSLRAHCHSRPHAEATRDGSEIGTKLLVPAYLRIPE